MVIVATEVPDRMRAPSVLKQPRPGWCMLHLLYDNVAMPVSRKNIFSVVFSIREHAHVLLVEVALHE